MTINIKYSHRQLTNLGEEYNKKILLDYKESLEELLGPIFPEHQVKKQGGKISSVEFIIPESESAKQEDLERKSSELNEKYHTVLDDVKGQADNLTRQQILTFLESLSLKWFDYRNLIIVDGQVMLKCWGVKSKYIEHLMNTAVSEEEMKIADTIMDDDSIELDNPDCELPKEKKSIFTSGKVFFILIIIILMALFWPRISSLFHPSSKPYKETYSKIYKDTNSGIQGTLRTNKNKIVKDAQINLYKNDEIIDIAFTNNNGAFIINNLKSGRYSLKIEEDGYDTQVEQIDVTNSTHKKSIDILLKKQNIFTIILNKLFPKGNS